MTLLFQANPWQELIQCAQLGLNCVLNWLNYNRTINAQKTKYVLFGIRSNLLPTHDLPVIAHELPNRCIRGNCSCPTLQFKQGF